MIRYNPPYKVPWKRAVRGQNPRTLRKKFNAFFATYFKKACEDHLGIQHWVWKTEALPNVHWSDECSGRGKKTQRQVIVAVFDNTVMLPTALDFPLAPNDPASFAFLARVNADCPFKLNPKYFQLGINDQQGKTNWRKPNAAIAARLREALK